MQVQTRRRAKAREYGKLTVDVEVTVVKTTLVVVVRTGTTLVLVNRTGITLVLVVRTISVLVV